MRTELPDSIRAEYPFASNFHRLPCDYSLHYLDEGPKDAPVVLMVHGNPTWSFFYRHLVRTLSPHFRSIVPDHLGMGLSERPQNYDYNLKNHIGNLASLLAYLKISDYHLIVHDWGGPIGLGLHCRGVRREGKTVIFNTAAFVDARLPRRIALCRLPWVGEALVRHFNAFAGAAAWMAPVSRLSGPVKRGFLWPYQSYNSRVGVARFVQDIPMHPTHPSYSTLLEIEKSLPELEGDKLLLWGLEDFCFTPHFLERWKSIYPHAQRKTFQGAGHYLLEDRREEIANAVEKFLLE